MTTADKLRGLLDPRSPISLHDRSDQMRRVFPALAAVVEAGKGVSDKAGPGVTACSVNTAIAVDHAITVLREALSALDAAVAREVGNG